MKFEHKVGLIMIIMGFSISTLALLSKENNGFSLGTWAIGVGMGWFGCSIKLVK